MKYIIIIYKNFMLLLGNRDYVYVCTFHELVHPFMSGFAAVAQITL